MSQRTEQDTQDTERQVKIILAMEKKDFDGMEYDDLEEQLAIILDLKDDIKDKEKLKQLKVQYKIIEKETKEKLKEILDSRTEEERQDVNRLLFDFWEKETPIIKLFDEEDWSVVKFHVRYTIVDVLAKGVDDIYPGTKTVKVRRALTLKEIYKLANKQLGKSDKITKTNLYFHIEKLEKAGFIREIAQKLDGNRIITHYGRTARGYIMEKEDEMEKDTFKLLKTPAFEELVQRTNPGVDIGKVHEIVDKISLFTKNDQKAILAWFRKYDEQLKDLDIDYRQFHYILILTQTINRAVCEGFTDLSKILNIDQIESSN